MKKLLFLALSLSVLALGSASAGAEENAPGRAKLLYQGHGSLRIVTADEKVIYIDPYAGEGYEYMAYKFFKNCDKSLFIVEDAGGQRVLCWEIE